MAVWFPLRNVIPAMLVTAAALWLQAPASAAEEPGPVGCILRQSGEPARFVAAGSLDRSAVAKSLATDGKLRRGGAIDPCVLGQRHQLSARSYARLAARHPQRFAPLSPEADAGPQRDRLAAGKAPSYRFVGVDQQIPPDTFFFPYAIGRRGELVGGAIVVTNGVELFKVAVFDDGQLHLVADGTGLAVNARGTIAGDVLVDAENFVSQAAVFQRGMAQPIPLLPGEVGSTALAINDGGDVLVLGFDADGGGQFSLWDGRRSKRLDFGPDVTDAGFLQMNNRGMISGTAFGGGERPRAFRHDPRSGATLILDPLPTESDSWGLGINERGEVLGYSFDPGATERIGVWDSRGVFRTHFVQGTPDVPTISNRLAFNDRGTIVITQVSQPAAERGRSYLVPAPGVRVDLASLLVGGEPAPGALERVEQINDAGQMFGVGALGFFELTRARR